jgi:hypothetical protein
MVKTIEVVQTAEIVEVVNSAHSSQLAGSLLENWSIRECVKT